MKFVLCTPRKKPVDKWFDDERRGDDVEWMMENTFFFGCICGARSSLVK